MSRESGDRFLMQERAISFLLQKEQKWLKLSMQHSSKEMLKRPTDAVESIWQDYHFYLTEMKALSSLQQRHSKTKD